MFNTPLRLSVALDSTRMPLQPSSRSNAATALSLFKPSSDLDKLASELLPGPNSENSIKSRFHSPSATIASFKTNELSSSPSWMKGIPSRTPKTSPIKKNHLSSQSNHLPGKNHPNSGYEYLCRIQAIKSWMEKVLEEQIDQSPVELISYIKFGIHLAKLLNLILPTTRKVFTNDTKLQFKHTENINRFFELLDFINLPELFRFELTDLYDAKNVPKVWFCLHALSYTMANSNPNLPTMENLVDQIEFSDDDIATANRALLKAPLPNFASALGSDRLILPTKASPRKIQLKKDFPLTNHSTNTVETARSHLKPTYPSAKVASTKPQQENHFISKSVLEDPFSDTSNGKPKSYSETTSPIISKNNSKYELISSTISSYDGPVSEELTSQALNVIKLQALIRGSNFRYQMFVDRIMLRSFVDEFTQLFSVIRGNKLRDLSVHRHRHDLIFFKEDIITLQAAARRKLTQMPKFSDKNPSVLKLQSLIRGNMVRSTASNKKSQLLQFEDDIISIQSLLRKYLVCKSCRPILENRSEIESSIILVQANARRCLVKRAKASLNLQNLSSGIIELQSLARAGLVRKHYYELFSEFRKYRANFKEFQSIARGAIVRTGLCNSVLVTLIDEDCSFNELFAVIRGKTLRRQVQDKITVLQRNNSKIVLLQSHFRGILVRFEKELVLDLVYENLDQLIQFQAIVRGSLLKTRLEGVESYYLNHVQQVIRCQAIIRSNYDQRAYKLLIAMQNPPISTIRRFAFLLTDNEIDYQEEAKLAQEKDGIIEKSKTNEDLEQQIENLDIKLQLLDRNKISIEELLNHKKYNVHITNKEAISTQQLGLSKLQRKRLEVYQLVFYLLQTNPNYLTRLILKHTGNVDHLIKLVVNLYPLKALLVDHHLREELNFVKLIRNIMDDDIKHCKLNSDINKGKMNNWIRLFQDINCQTSQIQHLKLLLGRIIFGIASSDDLDFELNPLIIHGNLREREIKVRGNLDKPATISPQQAIKDDSVASKFVENLMSLRETASETLDLLFKNAHRIPLHVKVVARHAYDLSKAKFSQKSENLHLAVAGVTIFKHYIASILLNPDDFGISIGSPELSFESPATRRSRENLRHLSKVLLQGFSLKPFQDNFLKPLNDYLEGSNEMTANFISKIIDVQSLEDEYDMSQYDDVISTEKPRLTLKVPVMLDFVKIITEEIDEISSIPEDPLRQTIEKLKDMNDSASDFVSLAEMGQVTLSLNPISPESLTEDLKTRLLMAQAKRALMYIIRVQDGPGLLELLILGIKPEHETKFRQIIQEEQEELSVMKKGHRPYNSTSLGDLSILKYRDLKKLALEIILKLESEDVLTRKNSYQDLLNEIALDIKTKHSKRGLRKQQLEITSALNRKLVQKEKLLKEQLKDYNHHIQSVLAQVQLQPKDRKLFNIIPVFSKQYFYHRELRRANRLPKFGLYKYLAKKLMDQGILKDYSSKYALSLKLDFMFSCHEAAKFLIDAATGSAAIAGAHSVVTLDQLLNLQYEKKATFELFDGAVLFDTENLVAFIFRKFYDVKKE